MARRNSRKKIVCALLATSFTIQSNLACLAAPVLVEPQDDTAPFARAETGAAIQEQATVCDESTSNNLDAANAENNTKIAYGNFTLNGPLGSVPEPDANATAEERSVSGAPQLLAEAALLAQSPAAEQFTLSGGASISPEEAVDKIDDLTKQILLKEIELQKFNLHYTQEVAKQGRWKGWRYATLQEINTGMNLSGSIISVINRGAHIHRSQGVHLHLQESANYIPMIGSIIGASAAVMEFGINGYHDIVARRHGFSPKAAMTHVQGLKDEIDKLMAERTALTKIEASSQALLSHVEVDEAEGKVLKDLRDQSLQEFQRFHVGARKLIAFQQWQYFFDFAKYTTSAIGSEFAYLSLYRHHRVWNGRAGVLFVVSGQLTMWGPILSRLAAKGVGELTKHRIRSVVADSAEAKVKTLQADMDLLNALIKRGMPSNASVANAVDRQGLYGEHQKTFVNEITAAEKKNSAAKLTATQNIGAGLYVGGSKTASGVLFVIPGFNSHYNSTTTRAGRVTNDLLFSSALIGIPSGAFAMLDTLRIQVRGEIDRHKAMKAGLLPGQIASARLKQLDDMEARLRAK